VKAELLGDQNRWFALYTRSRHEKRVAEALEQRGFDTYLPLVPRVSEWHDRKKTVLWPLFPGYVFVRLCPEDAATVLSIPGSVQVIGVAGRPAPIPDEDIDNVKMFVTALITTGAPTSVHPALDVGAPAKVSSGAFAGVTGIVLEDRKGKVVLQVGLHAIGQGLRLELPREVVALDDHPEHPL